jgi:peptidoglycan-associated lipoprotein
MKKALIAALSLALLYGCASQDVQPEGKAGVEDRSSGSLPNGSGTAKRETPEVQPLTPDNGGQAGNPLKDPNNVLSKRSIYFDYDSDAVKDEYRPLLQAHANYLKERRAARMLIQGNADERGSREYNIALGQRRADNIKRMLVLLGGTEAQLESVSLGEEKPRCSAQTEECYRENRRGDLLYNGEY